MKCERCSADAVRSVWVDVDGTTSEVLCTVCAEKHAICEKCPECGAVGQPLRTVWLSGGPRQMCSACHGLTGDQLSRLFFLYDRWHQTPEERMKEFREACAAEIFEAARHGDRGIYLPNEPPPPIEIATLAEARAIKA